MDNLTLCVEEGVKEEEGKGRNDKKPKSVTGKHNKYNRDHLPPGIFKFGLSVPQMPDPSQVTAVVTPPFVAAWLVIYFQPSDNIRVSFNHLSKPRLQSEAQTAGMICLTCSLAGGQGVCDDHEVCFDWSRLYCCSPDAKGHPWEPVQCRTEQTQTSYFCQLLLFLFGI